MIDFCEEGITLTATDFEVGASVCVPSMNANEQQSSMVVNAQELASLVGKGNHRTRKILQDRCLRLKDAILISGGNEYYDGNIQVFVKRAGRQLTPPITKHHDEIAYPTDKSPEEMSCEELQQSSPQLLFTNMTVACLMLNAFYGCLDDGFPKYNEAYFDILQNCVRPVKR